MRWFSEYRRGAEARLTGLWPVTRFAVPALGLPLCAFFYWAAARFPALAFLDGLRIVWLVVGALMVGRGLVGFLVERYTATTIANNAGMLIGGVLLLTLNVWAPHAAELMG